MKRLSFRVVLAAGLMLSISGAAVGANRKAQRMVQGLTSEQATLLVKFPALTKIDGVIRADCAVKNEGRAATDDFCGCAAAVTMGLWRSGADPNMVPRLNDYLKNPTDAAANGFLQYQGPELSRRLQRGHKALKPDQRVASAPPLVRPMKSATLSWMATSEGWCA